jgi:type III pantothenate kinase
MIPDVVVDIGNTRIKWGRCTREGVAEVASLPPNDPRSWQFQVDFWRLASGSSWAVAGVHPHWRETLVNWLRSCGNRVTVLENWRELPLTVRAEAPERVGMDRLFDAVAVNSRRSPDVPGVVVDAGSAVTIDRVEADGAFIGGAILPGLGLMARSLHEYTALLPLVEKPAEVPVYPGTTTETAIQAGIYWAVVGAVRALRRGGRPEVYVTGGDAPLLRRALGNRARLWPEMTLEGIRLSAKSLP